MTTTRIVNPRVYTKDSFYYQFVWEWEVVDEYDEIVEGAEPVIDLQQEYEILIYRRVGSDSFVPCNLDNLLNITYNKPISALDIENACRNSEYFSIPDNCNCFFKIREKKTINPEDWETIDFFPQSNSYQIMPVPLNCNVSNNSNNDVFSFSVGQELKNYYKNTHNQLLKYLIAPGNSNLQQFYFPSLNCYVQPTSYSTIFQFNLYYNSNLKLNTEYTVPIVYQRELTTANQIVDTQKVKPITENVIDRYDIYYKEEHSGYSHNLPNENGALVYIEQGDGWKINQIAVESNHTYKFTDCGTLVFEKGTSITDLKGHFFTAPFEQNIDFGRDIMITTGVKYKQQTEAFDDLETIRPVSNISNNEFTYQYDSINGHTPVFIYQKMIDNTYNLTNNLSNLNTGVLNTDFENTSKNDLIVTTSPVINYKYGTVSLNGNTYTHINVQDYKNFIISTIKIGSGIPSDHTSGYIQIAYDDDFSFENAQIVNNNDVINVENYNYVNIKFVRDIGSGSSIIKYFLEEEGEQSLKTSNITEEEINEYTEEHQDMLNVNKVFNSLEEEFEWEAFQIIQSKGQPKLDIRANKDNNFSNLYSYKILIKNKITNRAIVNEELDFKYSDTRYCWCIYKNEVSYPGGYILSELLNNELGSKEEYYIIVKRIYNEDEYIIEERDVVYEDNTDFFLAPSNNINYNPGEEINFYFSTERNDNENASQGYPWLIYNNEDNVGYFCYSNQAQNDLGSESVHLYDKTVSDNKQLIHINYHDKPNFTPKEVIPMLDFKITELVETISQTNTTNEESMIIDNNPSNFSATTNGTCGSFEFDISNQNTEGYIRFVNLMYTSKNSQPYQIEILDSITNEILFSANNLGSADITNAINRKKISKNANLKFNLTNCTLTSSNTSVYTLNQQNNESLLQKRKFYIDNFSTNEIDYSEIENGSVITGQVLELHKPITLHIEDFTTNMSSNNSIYYKIEKINEYNQDVITPIDDDNSITILQKDRNGNEFTKDFYINSHTNQLKIQNTKTKQITFNNAQKDTIVNCILEKEEVED